MTFPRRRLVLDTMRDELRDLLRWLSRGNAPARLGCVVAPVLLALAALWELARWLWGLW